MEKGVRLIDAFFIGIWIANYLGPTEYGVLSYSESFVYLFTAIAALGLDQIIVKELVAHPEKRDSIMGTALSLRFLGFGLMILVMIPIIWLQGLDRVTIYLIFFLSMAVALQGFKIIDFYFQSQVQSRHTAICNILVVGSLAVFKVYLISFEYSLLWFGFAIFLEWLLLSLTYLLVYRRQRLNLFAWRFDKALAKKFIKKGRLLVLGSVAAALYMKIDQVMIRDFLGEYEVGIYSVAVKLTSVWIFVTVAINQSIFPSLVATRKESRAKFIERLQKLYDILMKVAVFACISYTFLGPWMVDTFFGLAYAESSQLVVIYIWSIVFLFLSNASWGFYLNEGLEKLASIRLVVGAVVNISLNIILIRLYGLEGAAYATLISYALSGYLINGCFKDTRENFYLQTKSIINILSPKTWIKPL